MGASMAVDVSMTGLASMALEASMTIGNMYMTVGRLWLCGTYGHVASIAMGHLRTWGIYGDGTSVTVGHLWRCGFYGYGASMAMRYL